VKTQHALPGLRPEPLASYLAGLGLIRVLGEQADRDATAAWAPDGLAITSTVEDIAAWLAESYVPTPVLSPWNNGSGFGTKDKEPLRVLNELREHRSPRLAQYRAAISIAEYVVSRYPDVDKKRLVQEFRNRCPEELLPWIDASVVLTGDDVVFPPLLGTGGNDGRLDFSTNFHQRLLEVVGTPRSLGMARDLLAGTEAEQLANAAIGQFDPAGAGGPGSSRFGTAPALVNAWGYVLFVEGALLFASSTVRRNQFAAGRAAMPFTVAGTPEGTASGAAGEESRGEVWTPLWSEDFTLTEIRQLFAEARASWRGRPARRATDFYAATRALGVARGVTAFTRYGMQRRNGLAFTAVPLDRVDVRERAEVRLAADVEDWAARFRADATSAAVGEAARRFQHAHLAYVRDGGPRKLAVMLAALTGLEQAVGRSGRARDDVPVRFTPPAGKFLAELAKDESPELRVAVGLASCRTLPGAAPARSMRQLLLPVDPGQPNGRWRASPVISGFGTKALPDVLADVLIWRSRTAADEPAETAVAGLPTFRAGIRVPADDLHELAAGRLVENKLDLLFRACLALNWQHARHEWTAVRPRIPVPTLGVLQPLADGFHADDADEPALALGPDWPERLAAGQVSAVHDEAVRRLRRVGWDAVPAPPATADGVLIAAALVPRCLNSRSALSLIAAEIKKYDSEEQR
jgi:CRISPR-associated protein Csx17